MLVQRDPGELYLLRHTAGDEAVSWVERIDPESLDTIERSPDLPGGPTWPGGVAAHANGSVYVVFGRHAHRLGADTGPIVTRELPREHPYNSFVVLPDGCLVTKDFGGTLPGRSGPPADPTELLVLEPDRLDIVGRLTLPERSIARLSADGNDIFVVGDTSLFRVRWDGNALTLDDGFLARYRTIDNGDGSERYAGTFHGQGISPAPLHLVRVDLASGAVELAEVCGLPLGVIANPPVVDPERRIAVGYDSGNGVLAAFSFAGGALEPLWTRQQDHACHPLRYPDTGELVTGDHDRGRMADQVVVLDIETGAERARADTGSPVQSVLFPCPGFGRDLYVCSFTTVSRVRVVD